MNKHCCHIRPQRACQSERLGSVNVQEVVWEATSEHQRLTQIEAHQLTGFACMPLTECSWCALYPIGSNLYDTHLGQSTA